MSRTLTDVPPDERGIPYDEWRKRALEELFRRQVERPEFPKDWNEPKTRKKAS